MTPNLGFTLSLRDVEDLLAERGLEVSFEMHDCFLYASAAAIKYGINWISDQGWAKLRAELEAASPGVQAEGGAMRRIGAAKSIASMLAR